MGNCDWCLSHLVLFEQTFDCLLVYFPEKCQSIMYPIKVQMSRSIDMQWLFLISTEKSLCCVVSLFFRNRRDLSAGRGWQAKWIMYLYSFIFTFCQLPKLERTSMFTLWVQFHMRIDSNILGFVRIIFRACWKWWILLPLKIVGPRSVE